MLKSLIHSCILFCFINTFQFTYFANSQNISELSDFVEFSECYGDLGCFPVHGDFYHYIYRPVSLTPWEPKRINVKFFLYTRDNPWIPTQISRYYPDKIKVSNFDPGKPIKFIVHGFRGSAKNNWMRAGKRSILDVDDVNVVIVDWSESAGFPYAQAAANTRVVGREIGALLKHMQLLYNISYDNVHIIGHSLGAHTAGYAGEWLNGSIGRISALDAAAPFFNGMPEKVRLDPSDAKFVDAIHSDGSSLIIAGFGMMDPIGHIDFYPDNGLSVKSCGLSNYVSNIAFHGTEAMFDFLSCNHLKSPSLYMESIKSNCPFTAFACENFDTYKKAECYDCNKPGEDCISMGYKAGTYSSAVKNYNKKFYLSTNREPPNLCVFHWIIVINTIYKNERFSGLVNFFLTTIKGEKMEIDNIQLNEKERNFEHGETLKFLIEFQTNPQKIYEIEFQWFKKNFRVFSPSSWFRSLTGTTSNFIYPKNITLIPVDIIDKNKRQEMTSQFCVSDPSKGISHGEALSLQSNSC